MKTYIAILSLALALPTMALAEDGERKRKGHRLDTNGDGYVTKAEMLDAHKKRINEMFAKGDKDGDGKLSREELKVVKKQAREKMKNFREKKKERRAERKDSAE